MKKMVKTLLTIVSMIAITLSVFSVSASAAGNTIESATNLSIGSSCSGTLSSTNEYDYYKCNVTQSGKVHLKFVSYTDSESFQGSDIMIYIYDGNKETLDWFQVFDNEDLGYSLFEEDLFFSKGTFYIKIDSYKRSYGNYTVSTSFTSANESFAETLNDNDNHIGDANKIELNKKYYGQLGYSDEEDFYVLNIKSGCTVNILANAFSKSTMCISILDSSYNTKNWLRIKPDKNLGNCVLNENISFSEGTYYFKFNSDGESNGLGFYNFSVNPVSQKPEATSYVNTNKKAFQTTTTKAFETNKPDSNITNKFQTDINEEYKENMSNKIEESVSDNFSKIYTYNNFTYEIVDSEIVIIGYFGSDKLVVVPSDINGMSVVEIADSAFVGSGIEEITVPHTIIKFGENAFGQNDNTDIVIICDKNSAAEVYANKNGLDCQIKDEMSDKSDEMNSEINNGIPKEYIIPGIVLLIIIVAVAVVLIIRKNKNEIEKN